MTRALIVGLVLLLLVTGGASLVLSFFLLSARTALDQPNPLAVTIAESGKVLLVPPDAQGKVNPVASSTDMLRAANRTFTARCVVCHGSDGKGDTPIGAHIYPRAADLTAARTQSKSDGSLFWIIQNGLPHTGMPGWRDLVAEQDIWQLVLYLRQLPSGIPPEARAPAPTPTSNATPAANATPSASAAPASASVKIENSVYVPDKITIKPGTQVTWTNTDDDEHTVTAEGDTPLFDSDVFKQGESFSFTFNDPGTYQYVCTVHDYMNGVVIVE